MNKKLLFLLVLLLTATTGAWAQSNTVRWEKFQMSEFNLSSQGDRQTTDGVTLTSNGGAAGDNDGNIYFNGEFTFSLPAGSVFTQIVIRDDTWLGVTGWSVDDYQTGATWTGSARSVACQINASNVQYIEFTIAPAVPKMYTSDVSITDLVPGDTLAEGVTIIGSGNDDDMVYLNFGRTKENGVVPSFWTNLHLPPTVIGTNGTISGTYTPVDENGQDGNAWVVTSAELNDYDGFEVGLGGIIIPVLYTVTLAEGTEDAGKWTIDPTEAAEGSLVTATYSGEKKVKSVKAVKKKAGKTVNLSTLTADYEAQNGDVLTGETTSYKVTIAAGATVTLDGVNISSGDYCIKCLGDATIILKDGSTNTLTGMGGEYPALSIGDANTTLTIQGSTGVLNVTSGDYCAGIGGGYMNTDKKCGNIRIEGGVITAQGGFSGAGIGTDCGIATCGGIIITGGTITAKGGSNAAGIGTGDGSTYKVVCGDITIANTVTKVTATKGDNAPHSIGKGYGGKASCGTVTIGGTKYWENNAAVNGGDTYLATSPLIYEPSN